MNTQREACEAPVGQSTALDPLDLARQRARQVLYRFLGLALVDPRRGSWETLARSETGELIVQAADLLREEPPAFCSELAIGERPLADLDARPVLAHLPQSLAEWNAQYEQAFGLLAAGPCPPYATEYIASKFVFQRSNSLADIAGFYHAFGVESSPEYPERPDHIVLMLEFMALLILLELRATSGTGNSAREQAAMCRSAQQSFLRDHLAWWVPAFTRLLAVQRPEGFYAFVGALLAALLPAERALLGVATPGVAHRPHRIEPLDDCSGCELASL